MAPSLWYFDSIKSSLILAEFEGDVEIRSENESHHGYGTICGIDG